MGIVEQHLATFAFRLFDVPETDAIFSSACPTIQPLYEGFNGGLFWKGALLIRPERKAREAPLTVAEWNDNDLWKSQYDDICTNVTFFAEDVFGVQFGIEAGRVVQFDPETAGITTVAPTLVEWCHELCRDPDYYTGAPVLIAWERKNSPLQVGHRLVPRQLFMLGGDFNSDNMVCKTDVEGMRIRAQLWKLTRDLPDGQKVTFRVEE
jgi:hypothetical protein